MRAHAGRGLVLGVVALFFVFAGCGQDVDFNVEAEAGGASPPASVVSANGIGASVPDLDASRDASVTPRPVDARAIPHDSSRPPFPDARVCPSPGEGGISACGPSGAKCLTDKDCCAERCETILGVSPEVMTSTMGGQPALPGYCLPAGACAAPGAECSSRKACCSGRCEPTGPMGTTLCGPFCMADGSRCTSASECCSLGCNDGRCGGPLCHIAGQSCTGDAECCSGQCGPHGCVAPLVGCYPTGEGCKEDAGPPCCSNYCNATGRCDLGGSYPCLEPSSPCSPGDNCCRGSCSQFGACTAPCLADGEDCFSNGDCCGGVCTGAHQVCQTPPPACP